MIPHKHLLVRAKIANPISDTDKISSWLSNLIDSIQMKILYGPVSVYCDKTGNKGVTGFAIIETSHVVLHMWDESNPSLLQLDVYTCSELNIELVFKSLSIFMPLEIDYKFLDRENGFKEIITTPEIVVEKWVDRISTKLPDLDGHRICPFAKMPKVISVKKLSLESFTNLGQELVIYMETSINSSYEDLDLLCKQLKKINPNFVFLPDHPTRPSYIKNHQTGNGTFPCIIVQTKQELELARQSLEKTNYYSFWDETYLKEIKSFN